jgi:hypothetical protein
VRVWGRSMSRRLVGSYARTAPYSPGTVRYIIGSQR